MLVPESFSFSFSLSKAYELDKEKEEEKENDLRTVVSGRALTADRICERLCLLLGEIS